MSKRNEFKTLMEKIKKASPSITNKQRQGFIRQATEDYSLSRDEAEKILNEIGLTVGPSVNYFEVLGLSIDELKNLSETEAEKRVQDACELLFRNLRNSHNPRKRKQFDEVNEAKRVLIDDGKLQQYLREDNEDGNKGNSGGNERIIIKFRNGDYATSIPQLVTLMEKNTTEASDYLYGGYLKDGLAGVGQAPFAVAAETIVKQFPSDRSIGLMGMVAILREKIKMRRGNEAGTPQQIARLIDQNWDQAKTFLYNGFFAFWFEYTNQTKHAKQAKGVISSYTDNHDIGLEEFVQRLDSNIGDPEPDVSHSKIDFGTMDTKSKDAIQFKIKNKGRGFLHGKVQIESSLQGLQVSGTEINGNGIVTVALDTSSLTARRTHKASLVVKTNGGQFEVPISCYVDNPIQQSIQRVAVSGLSMAAIALVTRLIIQQFGISGWLPTGFMDWSQYWNLVEWFEWPWFKWKVYTLRAPGSGLGFIVALVSLGVGIFGYWYFFFNKKRVL